MIHIQHLKPRLRPQRKRFSWRYRAKSIARNGTSQQLSNKMESKFLEPKKFLKKIPQKESSITAAESSKRATTEFEA